MRKHKGPICNECGVEFYWDYLDKPEPHEGSGLCWNCWSDREFERRTTKHLDAISGGN